MIAARPTTPSPACRQASAAEHLFRGRGTARLCSIRKSSGFRRGRTKACQLGVCLRPLTNCSQCGRGQALGHLITSIASFRRPSLKPETKIGGMNSQLGKSSGQRHGEFVLAVLAGGFRDRGVVIRDHPNRVEAVPEQLARGNFSHVIAGTSRSSNYGIPSAHSPCFIRWIACGQPRTAASVCVFFQGAIACSRPQSAPS